MAGRAAAATRVLDEPASALDPISTAKIEQTLLKLRESYTIVVVTHNRQIAQIADRVVDLRDGRVQGVETNPTPKAPEDVEW